MINRRTNHSRSTVLRGLPIACALALALASIPPILGVAYAAESPPALAGVVNLNTASTGELQLLPPDQSSGFHHQYLRFYRYTKANRNH